MGRVKSRDQDFGPRLHELFARFCRDIQAHRTFREYPITLGRVVLCLIRSLVGIVRKCDGSRKKHLFLHIDWNWSCICHLNTDMHDVVLNALRLKRVQMSSTRFDIKVGHFASWGLCL